MSKKFEIINTDIICSWTYNLSKNTDCAICYNSLSCSSVPDFQKGNDSSIRIGNLLSFVIFLMFLIRSLT